MKSIMQLTAGLFLFISLIHTAGASVIDFGGVPPFTDVPTYTEDGFMLTTNVGEVRINNCFSPAPGEMSPSFGSCYAIGNNAAQPSFGFGQGMDSGFIFSHTSGSLFDVFSIDLLEATVFPAPFGVAATGYKSDGSSVHQLFTLDGVSGVQNFLFNSGFSGLLSLVLSEDSANSYAIDIVQIDNIVASPVPAPPAVWLLISGLLSVFIGRLKLNMRTHA